MATPENSTVEWAGAVWKVKGQFRLDLSNGVFIRGEPGRNWNGTLECPYHIGPTSGPGLSGVITLSTPYTGPVL